VQEIKSKNDKITCHFWLADSCYTDWVTTTF
jgi:hypothetical protein